MSFQIGDIVHLKSGGPDMTISSEKDEDGEYCCQWFKKEELIEGQFKEDALEKKGEDPLSKKGFGNV